MNACTGVLMGDLSSAGVSSGGPAVRHGLDYDVVIPTHARNPRLLDQTIASVVGQTLAPRRIIVVVDAVPTMTHELRRRWPQIDVVQHDGEHGPAAARQRGIDCATAEWVAFVDDDDLWAPRKSAVTADFIAHHPECRAVRSEYWVFASEDFTGEAFGGQRIDLRGSNLPMLESRARDLGHPSNDQSYLDIRGRSLEALFLRNAGVMGSTVVRRELLTALPAVPSGLRPGDDYLLFALVATRAEWWLIREPLLYYRLHHAQDTRQHDLDGALAIIRTRKVMWQMCGAHMPRPLESFGPCYRREFRTLVWPLLRSGRWGEGRRVLREARSLLPRRRDRLSLLVPEPVAWRFRRRGPGKLASSPDAREAQ